MANSSLNPSSQEFYASGIDEKNFENTEELEVGRCEIPNNQIREMLASKPNPPPDGGLQAWLQVLGGHFLFFNSWGLINTFGAYQAFYESTLPESSSEISWIGTFQGLLIIIIGVVTGPLYDYGYLRTLLFSGTFLVIFGLMMTSLGTQYYQIFLAQSVAIGLGGGCLCVPSIAVVSAYFTSKRAVATGLTAAGGGLGGVIYPIVFRRLQPVIGFGWATRAIGFIALVTLLISIGLLKSRLPPPGKARKLFDPSAFSDIQFVIFSCGMFLASAGAYVPIFYVVVYATRELHSGVDLAFYILSIICATSTLGRIIPGLIADKIGPLNMLLICTFMTSILGFTWLAVENVAGLIIFGIFYGFFSGGLISLPATVLAGLHSDMSKVGTRIGLSFGFAGLGLLIGSPLAGALLGRSGTKFEGGQLFSGATVMAGALTFLSVRLLRATTIKSWKI